MKMPPLPAPVVIAVSTKPHERREILAYSEAQILAYGAAVREECARIAEEEGDGLRLGDSKTAQDIADAIRKD